ncbi:hypothetical protein BS78_03G242500 [Paspalum vaginatum]|nr:hypothetical protein BS78_03G242500 [Paspalum vaginatum]
MRVVYNGSATARSVSGSEEEMFLVCILGWGIEWLQAYFLVLDDIMDNSHTRRGKPCWYRLAKNLPTGLLLCLLSTIHRRFYPSLQLMEYKHYFFGKRYYVDLLDLFNEVEFKTISGQLLDQITTHGRSKDQNKYTLLVYRRIAEYKTAYYSFYLPVACALLLSGQSLDDYVQRKQILVEMGVTAKLSANSHTVLYFQNDYLDCFGDPTVFGKLSMFYSQSILWQIGTDIEEFKCSWLFVQALLRADNKQKDFLFENYGKSDPACVAKVKALYKELDPERAFFEYERESCEKLISDIEAQPNETVQTVLKPFLHKIYKRRK